MQRSINEQGTNCYLLSVILFIWRCCLSLREGVLVISEDVLPAQPDVDHLARAALVGGHPLLASDGLCVADGEVAGQQLEQVAWPTVLLGICDLIGFLNVVAKELHLAPEVVAQGPADEVGVGLGPSPSLRDIEQAGLQVGNDVGTERQVLEDTALRLDGVVLVLLVELLRQPVDGRTVDEPRGTVEVVDERLELGIERLVVAAIDRHGRADGPLRGWCRSRTVLTKSINVESFVIPE